MRLKNLLTTAIPPIKIFPNKTQRVLSLSFIIFGTSSYTLEKSVPYSLDFAIKWGKVESVKKHLESSNKKLLERDSKGNTPLHNAVIVTQEDKRQRYKKLHENIVFLILEKQSCLNLCNNKGTTAGMIALENEKTRQLGERILAKERLKLLGS